MRVRVLYFAGLRERAGTEGDEFDLPEGSRLRDAVAEVGRRRPNLAHLDASIRTALNLELAKDESPLSDGDEVALLPPVSGG